jgi:hypothetical protein
MTVAAALAGAACSRPTPVTQAAESPIAFAGRVARGSQHGLLDNYGPAQLFDAMRGDTGEIILDGVRFATFSTMPNGVDVIHGSFDAFCAARGAKLEESARVRPTMPTSQRGSARQPDGGVFRFCMEAGGDPDFAYSLVDTGEQGSGLTRHLVTVAVSDASPGALVAFRGSMRPVPVVDAQARRRASARAGPPIVDVLVARRDPLPCPDPRARTEADFARRFGLLDAELQTAWMRAASKAGLGRRLNEVLLREGDEFTRTFGGGNASTGYALLTVMSAGRPDMARLMMEDAYGCSAFARSYGA